MDAMIEGVRKIALTKTVSETVKLQRKQILRSS